jgi:hypothetical protein
MAQDINRMASSSGRMLKEDNTIVNQANILAPSPVDSEVLTIPNTAGGTPLTPAKYVNATRAKVNVENEDIRVTVDGVTAPTATVGHKFFDGSGFWLESKEELENFLAISMSATNAVLQITYYA